MTHKTESAEQQKKSKKSELKIQLPIVESLNKKSPVVFDQKFKNLK